MILGAVTRRWTPIIRTTGTLRAPGPRSEACARFSQYRRACEEVKAGQTGEHKIETKAQQTGTVLHESSAGNEGPSAQHDGRSQEEQSSKQEQRNSKHYSRGGAAIPAFVLFAVGFPLGWYLNEYRPFGYRIGDGHSSSDFIKYRLTAKDNISSTAAVFRLRPSTDASVDLDDPAFERAITSVEFKQPQLQIARSYTCLPQDYGQHMDELRFLIRRERKGEVSNYLHNLPLNAEIDVRGLFPEYTLPEDVKSVAFLVGGTGIAPAMQAADIMAGQVDMRILWSSRRREDCIGGYNDTTPARGGWSLWPSSKTAEIARKTTDLQCAEQGALVGLIESLKTRSGATDTEKPRLLVDYFVDEEGTFVKAENVKQMLYELSKASSDSGPGRKILFVAGPEGFLNHWAGPKQWVGGHEAQGPLRGVLSTLDLTGWEVVKL